MLEKKLFLFIYILLVNFCDASSPTIKKRKSNKNRNPASSSIHATPEKIIHPPYHQEISKFSETEYIYKKLEDLNQNKNIAFKFRPNKEATEKLMESKGDPQILKNTLKDFYNAKTIPIQGEFTIQF